MSHSRIFIFKGQETDMEDVFTPDFEDIVPVCPAADYIDDDTDLSDDVLWFNDIYGNIITEKDGRYFIKKEDLMRVLEEEKVKRIKKAREKLLSKPPEELSSTDIYSITESLEDRNSFLFGLDSNSYLTTSLYFLDDLRCCKSDTLEIVKSYDYHF